MNKRKKMQSILCGILVGALVLGLVSGAVIALLAR